MGEKERLTGSGLAGFGCGGPTCETHADGQLKDHWILSDDERAKGFVRPVRTSYLHRKCGVVTHMPLKIGETYARDPSFYGATWCCGCRAYLPVGANGDFIWDDGTGQKVGT